MGKQRNKMKGFKGFVITDNELMCRDMAYKMGMTTYHDGPVELCNKGLHYCKEFHQVLSYYPINSNTVYCHVLDVGTTRIVGDDKIVTNALTVLTYIDGALESGDAKYHLSNGKLHRTDGPAIEYNDGGKRWYQNGEYHRNDGPAIEYMDGTKAWYQNGELHRVDGPAIEYFDGTKSWHQHGKLHRTDGPAIERCNGERSWYTDGTWQGTLTMSMAASPSGSSW